MENDRAEDGQAKTGEKQPKGTADTKAKGNVATTEKVNKKANQYKGNKWTLTQHWNHASAAKRVKWVFEGIGGFVALLILINYFWQNLQTMWNFRKENRPYLAITKFEIMDPVSGKAKEQGFQIGEPLYVNVDFKNIGKSTALNFEPHYHLLFGSNIDQIKPDDPDRFNGNASVDPGEEGAVTAVSLKDAYGRKDAFLNPADVVNWDGLEPVIVFGRLSYRDANGISYCTPFIVQRVHPNNWGHLSPNRSLSESDMCPQGQR